MRHVISLFPTTGNHHYAINDPLGDLLGRVVACSVRPQLITSRPCPPFACICLLQDTTALFRFNLEVSVIESAGWCAGRRRGKGDTAARGLRTAYG